MTLSASSLVTYQPSKRVFRHASDDRSYDCGRACAQMIITAYGCGVPNGMTPTPVEAAQRAPITQEDLRKSETDPYDNIGHWFTHPDELVLLLSLDPTLVGCKLTDWRVASCGTAEELLLWVGESLKRGFPAVLNIKGGDHWVCVDKIDYKGGVPCAIRFLDPLNPKQKPSKSAHTYCDGCATDGTTFWEVVDLKVSNLGSWQLEVGSWPPANYEGCFVAVVYGPPPPRQASGTRKSLRRDPPIGPAPIERILGEFRRVAIEQELQTLFTFLDLSSVVIAPRQVRDVHNQFDSYTIVSLSNREMTHGVIGIFDATDQSFMHMRFTDSAELIRSITGTREEEMLWWARDPQEDLGSPYFPFRQTVINGQRAYQRLIDGVAFTPAPN